VYRGGAKVGTVTGTATVPPATTFVDSGLTPSTAYVYAVEARDGQGNVSPRSSTTTVNSPSASPPATARHSNC
jgi:chitodextrinase